MQRILFLALMIGLTLALPAGAPAGAQEDFFLAEITWPLQVSTLHGAVIITGTADIPLMAGYTLKYMPLEETGADWIEIVTVPASDPVVDGVLGVWDTTTVPDGIYDLQLRVFQASGEFAIDSAAPLRIANDIMTQPVLGEVAFTSNASGEEKLYLGAITASGQIINVRQLITEPGVESHPNWSPDGREIVFMGLRDDVRDIYILNVEEGSVRNLTNDAEDDRAPAWSPTGEWIAFTSRRGADVSDIFVIRPDGSGLRRLAELPDTQTYPAWTPDGQYVVTESIQEDGRVLLLLPVDGLDDGEPQMLAENAGDAVWSPDGLSVVAVSRREENWDLYLLDADGKDRARLTTSPADDWQPAWSPDGRFVLFQSNRTGAQELYLLDVASGGILRMTDNRDWDSLPVWRP
ncbi:MAG: hypothetical protein GYB65_24290 [Chloroflexi bacterium]|nr:hypothetical protein [Chloroflexota bacterium]